MGDNSVSSPAFMAIPGLLSVSSMVLRNFGYETSSSKPNAENILRVLRSSNPYVDCYLYKSFDAAVAMLRMARVLYFGQNSALSHFFDEVTSLEERLEDTTEFSYRKVIAIEGLPCSGKSTLIRNITAKTDSVSYSHTSLHEWRRHFIELPEPFQRAFDCIANYFTALEVGQLPADVVFIENYYHAAAASALCQVEGSHEDILAQPSSAFRWPCDLPKPLLVLFLLTPYDVRQARIVAAHQLRDAQDTRERDAKSQMAYSLIRGAGSVAIDGSSSPEEVTLTALQCLAAHNIILAPDLNVCASETVQSKRVSMGVYGALATLDW